MTADAKVPIRRLNPPALGAPPGYSQVVEVQAARIIFIAGQTALDRDGILVGRDDFPAQADQVFQNLSAALEGRRYRGAFSPAVRILLPDHPIDDEAKTATMRQADILKLPLTGAR